MKTVINYIKQKTETHRSIGIAMLFSIVLLALRIKLNRSYFYIFLVWNLFLAVIPYLITMYLTSKKNLSSIALGSWFVAWLLFLPNAPYIITDLLHLKISRTPFLWFDILVVLSFAASGLFLFYVSLSQMQLLLKSRLNTWYIRSITLVILFLSALGVYLGRFLRYNSWEILSQPQRIIEDTLSIIFQPLGHKEAWLFIVGFGSFLAIGFWIFKTLSKPNYSLPST